MMKKYGFVYMTTNILNGKKYIGMCSDESRFSYYLGSGVLLKQSIEKHGKENFIREILEWCSDEDSLRESETRWISEYDAVNSKEFYNLSEGGRGGKTPNHRSMSSIVKSTWDSYSDHERKERISRMAKPYDRSGSKNPKSKSVIIIYDGVEQSYDCISDFADSIGAPRSSIKSIIRRLCNGLSGSSKYPLIESAKYA